MDGIPLVAGESQATVVMPGSVTTQPSFSSPGPRKRTGLWLTIGAVILLLGGIAIAGMIFYAYQLGNETGRAGRRANNANTSNANTATAASTQRTNSPSNANSTPSTTSPAASPTAKPDEDEPTPILWTTTADTFEPEIGKVYNLKCPPKGTKAEVWGSDVYTTDSSICTAAVHWGEFSLKEGGDVTIEIKPGRDTYGSSTRNGITTDNFGKFPKSFVFKDE